MSNRAHIYTRILEENRDRLLAMYDLDPHSPTRGCGDRTFWAWKLIDFPNGAHQGGVHALAAMLRLGTCFEADEPVMTWIGWIIEAADRIRHANGSMVEAFPNEHSFCVTALAAYDLLSAAELLVDRTGGPELLERVADCVRPMIGFISRRDEQHAFISNHLATAAAAVIKWNRLTGESNPRGREMLDRILSRQSSEGWYLEYQGPDPGYQTLCTYYLADCLRLEADPGLADSLARSLEFLSFCVHPDGTLGGEYGARNTEVVYPGGLEFLAREFPAARAVIDCLAPGIEAGGLLTPTGIDAGNYVPHLNSYAFAAVYSGPDGQGDDAPPLPFQEDGLDRYFPEAGIRFRAEADYYAVAGAAKGGVVKVYDKREKRIAADDCGWLGMNARGRLVSTQRWRPDPEAVNADDSMEIGTGFYEVAADRMSPLKFFILRLLCLTAFRSLGFTEWVKRRLVSRLITGSRPVGARLRRKIVFERDRVVVEDELNPGSERFRWLRRGGKFSAIHMASAGYFQAQRLLGADRPEEIEPPGPGPFTVRSEYGVSRQ